MPAEGSGAYGGGAHDQGAAVAGAGGVVFVVVEVHVRGMEVVVIEAEVVVVIEAEVAVVIVAEAEGNLVAVAEAEIREVGAEIWKGEAAMAEEEKMMAVGGSHFLEIQQ